MAIPTEPAFRIDPRNLTTSQPLDGGNTDEASFTLPAYRGTCVHDGWFSYTHYSSCRHALCGAYLLRELTCFQGLTARYDRLVAEGQEAQPPPGVPQSACGQALNLLRRLARRKSEVLRFLSDPSVPFDNNLAERDPCSPIRDFLDHLSQKVSHKPARRRNDSVRRI